MNKIAVIDYGMGNLHSVGKALEKVSNHLVQQYLSLSEELKNLKGRLGEVNREVYRETTQKIRLPKQLKESIYDIFE